MLLLQPGYLEDADLPLAAQSPEEGADFTPCARVPEDEIYLRTTSTDAARLVLYPLPWDEPAGARWRNRAAWSVFAFEAAGRTPPWLEHGVPLALVGLEPGLAPAWLDRHAVARPAGRPRRRVLTAPHLDARYWMARFDQFCAEASGLDAPVPAAAFARHLPPVGLLPRAFLTLTQAGSAWRPEQHFFPANYTVDVCVAPLEQLDALIADSVRLEPYAVDQADAVRLLLPVGQQWFDPALLQVDPIDPRFEAHVTAYRKTRGEWLAHRFDLAQRRFALELAIDGRTTPGPRQASDPDERRLESPEEPVAAPPGEATQFGVTRAGPAAAPTYASDALAALHRRAATFLKKFTAEDIAEFTALFSACGLTRAQAAEAFAPGKPPEWLARLEVGGNDKTLDEAERNELRRELLAYVRKQTEVQESEEKKLGAGRLQELIDHFSARADEADELVDAGFLKVRTDVFRLGSLLSNSSLAQKFTASASLANIIERKPPKADAAGVNAFASQLLANFAPSPVAGAAAAVAKPAAPAAVSPAPLRNTATLNAAGLRATSFVAKDYVDTVGRTGAQLESNKSALTAVNDKLLGANSPLTADEKAAYTLLRDTAQNLTSVDLRNQLLEVAEVAKFADNYVANFDLLSQKQLRAIPLERLQPALAPAIRREIHDGRLEIFERLTRLNLSLADLTTDFVDAPGTPVRPAVPSAITQIRFQTLISRRRLDTLATLTAVTPGANEINDADESRHFASGVSYADMALAALRAVERRIREYRAFVEECRRAQQAAREALQQVQLALAPVEVALDEARQDVAVALALAAEEQARLDAINARRAKVLQDRVEFLVFHRPRAIALATGAPVRRLEPAFAGETVLDCLRDPPAAPADLAALREAFRASPVRWFRHAGKWIDLVDRREPLRALLERSAAVPPALAAAEPAISPGRFHAAIGKVVQARQVAAQRQVAVSAAASVPTLAVLSWLDLRQRVERELTLGQLIAAGPAPLARAAAEELDRLFAVASCLHEQFSRVPGLVRLEWAERFGQLDRVAAGFRDLSRLPGWPGLDFTLRREMQRHADWLFGRIDEGQPGAGDLIDDLIRVALLLASHAPVDQLIVGHPIDPEFTPRPGALLRLQVDPARIRRGMEVFHQAGSAAVLRAVVEDIGPAHVAARIVAVDAPAQAALKLTPASTLYFREAAR